MATVLKHDAIETAYFICTRIPSGMPHRANCCARYPLVASRVREYMVSTRGSNLSAVGLLPVGRSYHGTPKPY